MNKSCDVFNLNDTNTRFLPLLRSKWNEIHNKSSVFRYKVDKIEEKVIDGYYLQLNPNRNSKRRMPECIDSVCQPFDSEKFNFTHVTPREIMFHIADGFSEDLHTVLVNVSPISRYHSLLCPSVDKCLPQIVTVQSLELAIKLMFLAGDRVFRLGFNSLCAFASVNHLHYHLFEVNIVLPVETAKCQHLNGPLYSLVNYPVPAFCYQIRTDECILEKSMEIFKLIEYFLRKSIAHNMFLTKGFDLVNGKEEVLRILVWPRRSTAGVKVLQAFNVAICELSGWFPIYNVEEFNRLQPEDLENELAKWKIDDFHKLCDEIKTLYS